MKINTKVNTIPSLTWNWLKMNNGVLNIDCNYKEKLNYSVSKLPKGIYFEKDAEKFLMTMPPAESAMGKDFSQLLFDNRIIPSAMVIDFAEKIEKPVYYDFECKDKTYSISSHIIEARKDSSVTVIMNFTSDKASEGLQIVQTKLYARKNAKIHLITIQTLGKNYVHVNDISTYCEENANIEVTQIELGSKKAFTGVDSILREYQSSFKSDTAYFTRKDQELDMNYIVNHIGRKTECEMMVYGTLKDNAKKTYRGTIDFKNGCQGANGNEQEETLLLNPQVVNKSIPVILCDEEDVAGEHGSTIGKLSNDVLFYMNSHGISKDEAEKIMTLSKINRVSSLIPDEKIKTKIQEYVEEAFNE